MAQHSVIPVSDYHIVFDRELSAVKEYVLAGQYSSITILVDDQTKIHCLPLFEKALGDVVNLNTIEIAAGEQHKTLSTCEVVWAGLLNLNVDRKGLLINLGGGVIGDLGGFVASCYKRGIDFIQVPTTLLSQVDASVGGKLGVDFQYGKNIIGLFRNPGMVAINTDFLQTLPARQFLNGFAEIFKHALIRDAEQWEQLKGLSSLQADDIEKWVFHSVSIKKQVVEEDPYEKHLRKILNFGHTLGHAVEAWSLGHDEEPLLHGEAVAIGMVMETFLSVKYAGLDVRVAEEVARTMLRHYGKYTIRATAGDWWPYLLMDKKNSAGKVNAVLLSAVGVPLVDVAISEQDVAEAIHFYQTLSA